jgi:hypothetical protein
MNDADVNSNFKRSAGLRKSFCQTVIDIFRVYFEQRREIFIAGLEPAGKIKLWPFKGSSF